MPGVKYWMLQEFLLDTCQSSTAMSADRRVLLAEFLGISLDRNGDLEGGDEDDAATNIRDRGRSLSSSAYIDSVLAAAENSTGMNGATK